MSIASLRNSGQVLFVKRGRSNYYFRNENGDDEK